MTTTSTAENSFRPFKLDDLECYRYYEGTASITQNNLLQVLAILQNNQHNGKN
jgi:hypothetical protein